LWKVYRRLSREIAGSMQDNFKRFDEKTKQLKE
jgi:hypothetical protein